LEIVKAYFKYINVVDYAGRGKGINCSKPISKGDILGIYLSKRLDAISEGRILFNGWIESKLLGRYANHNSNGNCIVKKEEEDIYLIACQDIKAYDEITLNYISVAKLINLPRNQYSKYGIEDFDYIPALNVKKSLSLI
tara:strand:+ start:893 stop:1309 length:417 start_codon:yes stop_codon:yes gene_type:complete